ncbi:MAG TPA: thermonuclease family protein [Rhizomicrobium sp.]|jgi:endonuclease YncB( thermonuclease family)|nr:thermonuclease family protein [Rhizomicrobium sp.]
MTRRIAATSLFTMMLCAGAAHADGIPACAGAVELGSEIVTRIEPNAALITTDGLAVKMEGIRLPLGSREKASGTFTDQAYGMLATLVKGRTVALTAIEPKQDRYDRLRAQVFGAEQVWVQQRLLEQGLARVALSPDRTECSSELYAAEASARAAQRGIWSSPAYAIRTPDNLRGDVGTFQVVEGVVQTANVDGGRAYLNFGADWRTDLTVTISPDDMKTFDLLGVDPRAYAGKRVRVRGMVQMVNGPSIAVANPQSVEVVN